MQLLGVPSKTGPNPTSTKTSKPIDRLENSVLFSVFGIPIIF
jgi:hypothetical protein